MIFIFDYVTVQTENQKNGSVFLRVFTSETQKLHLRRLELNSHSFSERVFIVGYAIY